LGRIFSFVEKIQEEVAQKRLGKSLSVQVLRKEAEEALGSLVPSLRGARSEQQLGGDNLGRSLLT